MLETTQARRPTAALSTLAASVASRLSYGRALALVTAAGAVLRFAFIARQALGVDEDFTAVVVHQPVGRMIDIASRDSAPPLFYVLERAVVALFDLLGQASFGGPGGPVALRLVPTLAGIALIPLLAALARRVAGDSAGVWAAVFAALAPTTVTLSGFARMYGLAAMFTVAATLLLWRALEKPGRARWAAYVVIAAAAVWSDYFSAVALVGILAAALWLRPGRRTAALTFGATVLALASIAPWLVVARSQFDHAGQGFWVPPLSPTVLGGTLAQLFVGPAVDDRVSFGPALFGLQAVAAAAGFACLAGAVFAWRRLGSAGRRAAGFCLLASSGVALLAVAGIWRPLLDARYANVMWLPLFALAGVGLAAMPRRLAGALVAALAVPTLALSIAPTHTETSWLVPELNARVKPGDLAAAASDQYLILLDETDPGVQARLHVLTTGTPPWFLGTAAFPPGAVIHAVPPDVVANRGRVFWIAGPGVAPPALPAGYHSLETRCVTLACLTIYGPAGE
ncbi:MAG TPA: glycosyltransferase family 39 protein [Candidatus Limnocylindrales bacterium]